MASTRAMISNFLKTDPGINAVNFRFMGGRYSVSTSDYRTTVAGAFAGKDNIAVGDHVDKGARASYSSMFDTMDLPDNFSFTSKDDLSYLLHECTHVLFDTKNTGKHSRYEEEAVAYVAQAMYADYYGFSISFSKTGPAKDLGTLMFRVAANLSKSVSWGPHSTAVADEKALVDLISKIPQYRNAGPTNDSNAFHRSFVIKCFRAITPA